MKNRDGSFVVRSGFTLIEMLVVILIILMLSGMLFKIAGLVGSKAARARAIADIANLEYALAEYYSEYSMYPPTTANRYVYKMPGNTGVDILVKVHNDPGDDGFITDSDERVLGSGAPWEWGKAKAGSIGYEYGLVSYLWYRDQGQGKWVNKNSETHWYDQDTKRDEAAKLKWQHFLKDLDLHASGLHMNQKIGPTTYSYTNHVKSVLDPWNRGYKYESKPPFMKYKLWCLGPDGKNDTADDINNESFNE